MQIKSKAEFYRLWEAGVLGCKLRTWRSPEEAISSGVPVVGFREVGKAGGGKLDIVDRCLIDMTAHAWRLCGRTFVICEAAPDERGTLQGEVCRTWRGWEGTMGLSTGLRMREAAAAGLLVPRSSVVTRCLLREYLSPASLDDLDALLELFPDATVEFTCYGEHDFGRGRNTIFWEVRDY